MLYAKYVNRVALGALLVIMTGNIGVSYAQTCTALGPITSKDTIYQLLTDRFYNGDTTNDKPAGFDPTLFDGSGNDVKLYQGGDWKGIEQHITYLKDMGISAIWISAPYGNRDTVILDYQSGGGINKYTSYHGYHVHNYFTTNKHFGSMADFNHLCNTLHSNGIKLIIDFVTNHTSRYINPTANNIPEDGKLYEPNKDSSGNYLFDSTGEPTVVGGVSEQLLADPNNNTAFYFHDLGDRGSDTSTFGYRHKDLGSLADFSHENGTVVVFLEKAATFWKSKGVDGFRHDATLHMNPAYVKGLRDAIDSSSNSPVTHFGEFFIGRPDPKYDEYRSYPDRTGVNDLDFEYFRAATNAFGNFSETMADFGNMLTKTQGDYTYSNQAVPFLDNHDVERFRNIQPNDAPYHAALATLLTSRGVPTVYYGTEQYLTGFDTSEQGGRKFFETATTFNEGTTAFKVIKALSALRQQNEALAFGTTSVLYSSNDVLVLQRQFFDKQVIVATNRQPAVNASVPAINTSIPVGSYPDVLTGLLSCGAASVSNVAGQNQIAGFSLSAGETCVWSYNPSLGTASPHIGDMQPFIGRAGNTARIFGTGLASTTVSFGSTAAAVVSSSDTQVTVAVPPGVTGLVTVTAAKGGVTSNNFTFNVLSGDQNQVIFHVNATTVPGENIFVVGSIPELGSWDTSKSTEAMLNPNYPQWFLPVSVPANTTFQFKFIKKNASGTVTFETGGNRTFTSASGVSATVDTSTYTATF
jgi:cyclomaltodextrin glucanotransferase